MLATINESDNAFALETQTNVEEITSFSDQQGVNVDSDARVDDRVPMNAFNDVTLHEFLQRPFQVATFPWTINDANGTLLQQFNFPYHLFSIPAILRKLENFQYFRADLRLSLRINATRFHYGKLLMAFSPNHSNISIGIPEYTLARCASLPNVQVNATDGESVVLQVPFSLPFEYINLSELNTAAGAAINNMGNVLIFVLNELASGSTSPVNCTLFASFDNVRLAGMTASPSLSFVQPPSHTAGPPTGTLSFAQVIIDSTSYFDVRPQVGNAEQENKSSKGLVSGITETLASFAAPLSMVPGIGAAATAVATGASAIGGIAKAFGYSKPLDQSSNGFIQHRFPTLASGKGLETAPTLGCFPDNAVSPACDYISGGEDDMQLSRIFSTPGLIGQFGVADSQGPGQIIFTRHVTPVDCLCAVSEGATLVDFTPLSYAVSAFEYWRGSLRYQFQFVASSFHSVRLRIGWLPPGATLSADPNDSVNVVNHVLDINGSTEFNVVVPYLSKVPWKTVPLSGEELPLCTNGYLFVQIVNELTFSEAPVPAISANVWCSAGPDFQVAFPTNYRLHTPGPPPSSEQVIRPQGGTSLDDIRTSDYQPMIDANFFVDNNLCHGESISHLKHVLQRCCELGQALDAGDYRYNPWTSIQLNPDGSRDFSFVSWFAQLFRFARGSVGLRLLRLTGNNYFLFRNRRLTSNTTQKISSLTTNFQLIGVGANWTPSSDNYIPEAIIPFYSSQYGAVLNEGGNPYVTGLPGMDFTIGGGTARVTEFVGDDFSFGFIIGAPHTAVQVERWYFQNTS